VFRLFVRTLLDPFRTRSSLEAEIVALRHQVAVLVGWGSDFGAPITLLIPGAAPPPYMIASFFRWLTGP